ncbi:MAG: hypothetical protein FD153_995 [Rhodospirillaceae bacterium]|nr:MAG: hypothetical protein FD153_995 [Rhodospirillaceae bacterium]
MEAIALAQVPNWEREEMFGNIKIGLHLICCKLLFRQYILHALFIDRIYATINNH